MGDAVTAATRLLSPRGEAHRSASPRFSLFAVLSSLVSLVALSAIGISYLTTQPVYPAGSLTQDARGGSAGACRMSYMSPSYFRLDGFGREYSRLGDGPWGLYLYREAGWDPPPIAEDGGPAPEDRKGHRPKLTGTPVLFVPGNAGSFRQVRSLASAASRAWYELPGVHRKGVGPKQGGRPLDFFTLDFNDDFSAFHGQTLRDQAEYLADSIRFILSLYHPTVGSGLPDPTSVIVVAHSMGGVVARQAFLHPHFQHHSISTLITFATPHSVPPATVDRGVDKVYSAVNSYWRSAYALPPAAQNPDAKEALENLVLVSVGGGLSDVTIASESVSTASLLPANNSHGFTVFTTGMSSVGTPVDHLAILWCQQLMHTVATSILSIVDVRNREGVIPRAERVASLSQSLIGNLDAPPSHLSTRIGLTPVVQGERIVLGVGERLVVRDGVGFQKHVFVLPIPATRSYGSARIFSLLTDATVGRAHDALVEVYACASSVAEEVRTGNDDDLSAAGKESCTPLFPSHTSSLPASPHHGYSPDGSRIALVSIDVAQLEEAGDKTHIVVIVKPGKTWVLAEFGDQEKRVHVVDKSPTQLLFGGFKLETYPLSPMLVSEIFIPALDTSLLTLKARIFRGECQDSRSLFAPLIRQHSPLLHETRVFPNARLVSLYTLASGPYQQPPLSPFAGSGTRLQVYLDPTCPTSDLAIEVTVDIWRTLGALLMRYRMGAVAFPFALILLVFATQLSYYNAGSNFIPFSRAFSLFARQTLGPLMGFITLVSLLQSVARGTSLSSSSHLASPPWIADALLGNHDVFFVGLAAFLLFSCLGAVLVEYLVLQLLVSAAAGAVRSLNRRAPNVFRMTALLSEPRETLPTHRVFSMGALLLLVLFFAPYQFAFLVIFLVHFGSTVRSLLLAQDVSSPSTPASTKRVWDRYHYSFSTLFVMMSLLPITALILVVWVRNLAVGWLAPFSSDHNVLNIVGFLVNVEALHSGKMLQRAKGRVTSAVSVLLPTASAIYAILYGVRYTHSIYPLANACALWLAANNSEALVGAAYDVVVGKRRQSIFSREVFDAPDGSDTGKSGLSAPTQRSRAASPAPSMASTSTRRSGSLTDEDEN